MKRLGRRIISTVCINNILQSLNYRGGFAPPTSRCPDFIVFDLATFEASYLLFWSLQGYLFCPLGQFLGSGSGSKTFLEPTKVYYQFLSWKYSPTKVDYQFLS